MNPLSDIQRRFDYVKEEIEQIEHILNSINTNLGIEYYGVIQTLITNIEIAVDLGDNTSESWKQPYFRNTEVKNINS